MLQKSARLIVALLLALSMCPAVAFADDGSSGNFFQDLFYRVVGFAPAEEEIETQATASLYPSTLTAPPLTTSNEFMSGADLDICSHATNVLNDGILVGSGDGLYYFREIAFPLQDGGFTSAFRSCERFDIKSGTWSFQPGVPEWLEYCSVVKFGATADKMGYLVWTGTTMDTNDEGYPVHAANPRQRVYMLNLDDEFPEWIAASSDSLPIACGLVNNAGVLQAVGGVLNGSPTGNIYDYELSAGAFEEKGSLGQSVVNPQIEPYNGSLCIASYANSLDELQAGTGSPKLMVYANGSTTVASGAFPTFAVPSNAASYPSKRAYDYGSLAWSDSGCVMVGPLASDGSSDTFLMPWDGSSFSSYAYTAHDGALSGTAACTYLGKLYALGSTILSTTNTPGTGSDTGSDTGTEGDGNGGSLDTADEGDGTGDGTDTDPTTPTTPTTPNVAMVFRSTDLADASLVSGNDSVWRKGSSDDLTFAFSPDYGRFKHIVKVDDKAIVISEYDSMAGTTVVKLYPEFLERQGLGSHTITAVFDDGNTEVNAQFTIEGPADGMNGNNEGYTSKTQLASTSDTLPVLPLAVCAIVAVAVVCVALFRSSSRR